MPIKKLRGRVAANRVNRQVNRSQSRTQREREKLDNTVFSRGSRTTPDAPDATARRRRSYSLYYKGDGDRKDQFIVEERGNTRTGKVKVKKVSERKSDRIKKKLSKKK